MGCCIDRLDHDVRYSSVELPDRKTVSLNAIDSASIERIKLGRIERHENVDATDPSWISMDAFRILQSDIKDDIPSALAEEIELFFSFQDSKSLLPFFQTFVVSTDSWVCNEFSMSEEILLRRVLRRIGITGCLLQPGVKNMMPMVLIKKTPRHITTQHAKEEFGSECVVNERTQYLLYMSLQDNDIDGLLHEPRTGGSERAQFDAKTWARARRIIRLQGFTSIHYEVCNFPQPWSPSGRVEINRLFMEIGVRFHNLQSLQFV